MTITLTDEVNKSIDEFISNNSSFTAFDITTKIRQTTPCKHYEVRDLVHEICKTKVNDYTKSNIDIGGKGVILYHHRCVDPHSYLSATPSPISTSVAVAPVLPTGKKKSTQKTEYVVEPDSENRLNIPKKLLVMIGFNIPKKSIITNIVLFDTKKIPNYQAHSDNILFGISAIPAVVMPIRDYINCKLTNRDNYRISAKTLAKIGGVSSTSKYRFVYSQDNDSIEVYEG